MLVSYLVVAALQAWPLPLHLGTHLTGATGGDTGVYVWNTWVFRHEWLAGHWVPTSTETLLPLKGPSDLSLHNFTVFADLLALPLQPLFGVVATFNLVYLINVALAGFGMYLLARRLSGRVAESWLAGLLFACSPYLVTRGNSHFSLAAAAPLPMFVVAVDRFLGSRKIRDAAAAGAVVAWAACCDPYYAIYCVMLGAAMLARHLIQVRIMPARWRSLRLRWALDAAAVALGGLMVWMGVAGGAELRVGTMTISMHSLYTPMLALAVLVVARLVITIRPQFQLPSFRDLWNLARPATAIAVVAAILLAPQLYAMGQLVVTGRLTRAPVGWRSSAPGVDLLAFLIPNVNHPLAPQAWSDWLQTRPGGLQDQVASVSYVALAVIAIAIWRAGHRPNRFWLILTLFFASLTLGPFVQVAGVTTFVPTPWTVLRYLPIVGDARMPGRFDAVVTMGLAALFVPALTALTTRFPDRRRWILGVTGVLLVAELTPVPRALADATVPSVYRTVAADPRPVRVLDIPFGIRDGLSSIGNFSASYEFYQTMHGKTIIGGYLSRVPQSDKDAYLAIPMIKALAILSEGRPLAPDVEAAARASARDFLAASNIGYVAIDGAATSPALRAFVTSALDLQRVESADGFDLYVPRGSVTTPAPRGL